MKFIEFINESKEGKNVHLEHLEDEVLNNGVAGSKAAINFLRSLKDMLASSSESKVNVTTKWDGAPAIICGINPENDKFFVGTKGVFAKNPKLNYTNADIDANHPGEGLNNKLKIALKYLKKLNIDGIIQGDMMFTKDDIKKETINGEKYITFQPNTLVYAIPEDSKLAKTILASQMGIVFHTAYSGGDTLADMKSSFNIDIGNLKASKDVWYRDASFIDASGTATFTKQESLELAGHISEAQRILSQINSLTLNRISTSETFLMQIKTFNNTKVREGQEIKNTTQHTRDLIKWVEDRQNKEILAAKLEKTKTRKIAEKNEVLRFYRSNTTQLKLIFDLQNKLVDAKNMIVRKLREIKQVAGTFVRTDDGFKISNPEGFVAVDKLKGGAVKLIDRLEFSHDNFTATKNWSA
jgi:hypothetical protein